MTTAQDIYITAYNALGTPLTLDTTVPKDVRCAEAVSTVLVRSGIPGIPTHGIAGTAQLNIWLKNNHAWEVTDMPTVGGIVMCATGTSTKGSPHGHTAIIGKSWMMANDSDTGLFAAKYTYQTWLQYFTVALGFPTVYYALKKIVVMNTPVPVVPNAEFVHNSIPELQTAVAAVQSLPEASQQALWPSFITILQSLLKLLKGDN